ncbi:carboxylesterase family protein [Streptomyces sp. WAC07149]|uniref:carboxylesterase/lipase family protein n=1 Tax=Streptomyces sp. WAC07149 TaxID=2487425 RepID=UPI000F77C2B7|nr:carboxylesterase family protein [Streptomyces sp. WAC07149]RST01889.1 carboxylesterase family protein [Streptomyces sp. WAC07149]
MLKRTAHAAIVGALALGAVSVAPAVVADQGNPSLVRTDKGVVRGTVTGTVRTFQGIPYAAPPTGERPWAPTGPAERWRGIRNATEPGAACPQTGSVPPVGSRSDVEDCLFVNVTTPRKAAGKPRPVMVYLHGGDHTDGSGAMHGAQRLASEGDVVVVTVNYRLAALGYLAHPGLEQRGESGNHGFLAQQAAQRWVQRNAAAFGGDPDNVTLFGQSAGGYSTCAHMTAPSSAGLFDRVILQSAPCTADMGRRERADALRKGTDLTDTLQQDWRTAPVHKLVNGFGTGPEYGPVYGGTLLPRLPQEASASGQFNKVPVLQGINRYEERGRVYGFELQKKAVTRDPAAQLDQADYDHYIEDIFKEHAPAAAARYPVSAYGNSPALALAAALTDGNWARHSVDSGRALSRHTPTYTYEFADGEVPWYSDAQYQKPGFDVGAAHTFELPYLFELDAHESLTPAQQSLASGPGGIRPVDFANVHQYEFWKSLG